MANTHEVTVYIWREKVTGPEGARVIEDTGHSALKLQKIGADKGDYYFLSVWPSREGNEFLMPSRYGGVSAMETVWQKKGMKMLPKSVVGFSEKEMHDGKKPDKKYRFNGLNHDSMIRFMNSLLTGEITLGAKAKPGVFHLLAQNCTTCVAFCLWSGGAPDMPDIRVWRPTILEAWCERLVRRPGVLGQIVDDQGNIYSATKL